MGCGEPLTDIDEPVIPVTATVPVTNPVVSPESMKQMYSKQESLEAQLATLKVQLSKQEVFSKEVLELVELVANQATATPTTLPEPKKEGFLSKKEAQLEKMAKAIAAAKKIKNKIS
jgi:hypothetical protein